LQVERLEACLLTLGTSHDAKFAKKEKTILEGLSSSDASTFEMAQRELGDLLGFHAGKHESDASPDPWWLSGRYCIVFEDHSDAKSTSALGAEKARQAAGHPNWMRANQSLTRVTSETNILPVLVTPVRRAESGAFPHLQAVSLWSLDEFRAWAKEAVGVVRKLRRTLGDDCDLAWRAEAQEIFVHHRYDAPSLFNDLKAKRATDILRS
jgi:hypothetical protein